MEGIIVKGMPKTGKSTICYKVVEKLIRDFNGKICTVLLNGGTWASEPDVIFKIKINHNSQDYMIIVNTGADSIEQGRVLSQVLSQQIKMNNANNNKGSFIAAIKSNYSIDLDDNIDIYKLDDSKLDNENTKKHKGVDPEFIPDIVITACRKGINKNRKIKDPIIISNITIPMMDHCNILHVISTEKEQNKKNVEAYLNGRVDDVINCLKNI